MKKSYFAGLVFFALLNLCTPTHAASLKLRLFSNPLADNIRLATAFGDTNIADHPSQNALIVDVPIEPAPKLWSISAEWTGGLDTSFPVLFSTGFANSQIDIHLNVFKSDETVNRDEVYKHCLNTRPNSSSILSSVFEMFYWCKGAALKLEFQRNTWNEAHRAALQGWAVANYALFARTNPISPYGIDPDLFDRMEEVLREHKEKQRKDSFWKPLKIEDAELIRLSRIASDVRLASLVPDLIRSNRLDDALEINDRAINGLGESGQSVLFGVSRELLDRNRAYIRTLKER